MPGLLQLEKLEMATHARQRFFHYEKSETSEEKLRKLNEKGRYSVYADREKEVVTQEPNRSSVGGSCESPEWVCGNSKDQGAKPGQFYEMA